MDNKQEPYYLTIIDNIRFSDKGNRYYSHYSTSTPKDKKLLISINKVGEDCDWEFSTQVNITLEELNSLLLDFKSKKSVKL